MHENPPVTFEPAAGWMGVFCENCVSTQNEPTHTDLCNIEHVLDGEHRSQFLEQFSCSDRSVLDTTDDDKNEECRTHEWQTDKI